MCTPGSLSSGMFGRPVFSRLWNAVPLILHLVNPYSPFKTELPNSTDFVEDPGTVKEPLFYTPITSYI